MIDRIATQAASLTLAAIFTVLTLGGVNALAERESASAQATEVVAVPWELATWYQTSPELERVTRVPSGPE